MWNLLVLEMINFLGANDTIDECYVGSTDADQFYCKSGGRRGSTG